MSQEILWTTSMKTNKVRLELLKDLGFKPQGILDIGAHIGKWSMMANSVFPDTPILMIEGNTDNTNRLNDTIKTVQVSSPKSSCSISLLSDTNKNVTYYKPKHGSTSGSSLYRENTAHYSDENTVTEKRSAITLDQLLNETDVTYDFIKIDVQGSEQDILRGAPDSISNARFILLETQLIEYNQKAPVAHEIIRTLENYGFIIADIYELHYLPDGRLNEIDILFARPHDKIFSISENTSFDQDHEKWKKHDICLARTDTNNKSTLRKILHKIFKHT